MTDEQFTKQFISLSNTFYELSRYQDDYDKLIDTIINIFAKKGVVIPDFPSID